MSTINPNAVPQPIPGMMPVPGAIQAPAFGVPPTVPNPGAPTSYVPNANPGAVTQVSKGKNTVFCVGYIAAQKNAIKPTIDEAKSRQSFKALYNAMSEEEKAKIGAKTVLTNTGEPIKPDKQGVVRTITLTNTFSMTAFRTFFRADGKDANNDIIPGFDSIRQLTRYAVDMSENTVEFWVMKCLTPAGTDIDMDVDAGFRAGHIHDMGKRVACFKTKQLYNFVNALNQAHFQIVSSAALDKAIKNNTAPAAVGYFSFKVNNSKSKNSANGTTTVSIGVYDLNYAKRSIRQLGLNDDNMRTEEVAYIVLRNNTTGDKLNLSADNFTNAEAYKTLFSGQDIFSLSPRKTFTKADYQQPGMSDEETNAAFKAAKAAEIIPFETNKAVCDLWGLTADKYSQLTTSKGKSGAGQSAASFMENSESAVQAIRALINSKNTKK